MGSLKRKLWLNGRTDGSTLPQEERSALSFRRIQGDFYLNQLITGYGAIVASEARFFGHTTPCTSGHVLEDRIHIIYDCPQWENIRKRSPRITKRLK
ncbi:hypothetical protein CDAR_466851 [Caerostris darwini]|uniref:Uncharacterized protein n=1 Tax=Caerostris darwini TaxID=1538125 RepID=A0AAV4SDW6_9ARAC|nr:hypothetical protein CDAR_466851 [Caerostris darwini]